MDAGQRLGSAGVNILDAGVCVGAVQHLGIQHPRLLEVGDEGGLPLHQFERIHLGQRLANHFELLCLRRHHDFGHGERASGRSAAAAADLVGFDWPFGRQQLFRQDEHLARPAIERRGRFAAQVGGGAQNRLHGLGVAGLAGDHAADPVADFGLGGIGIAVEQGFGDEDERGCVVAALDGARLGEGALDGVELRAAAPAALLCAAQPFDGENLRAIHLRRQRHNRGARTPVHQDGAVAIRAVFAAEFDAADPAAAQQVKQRLVRGNFERAFFAI